VKSSKNSPHKMEIRYQSAFSIQLSAKKNKSATIFLNSKLTAES